MTPFVAIIGTRENTFSPQCETRGSFTLVCDARIDEGGSILDAYEKWGEGCVDHLVGDFSFAIWDASRRRLFCARDYIGIKPLYYACSGNALIVASSVALVRSHPSISDDLDEGAITAFLVGESFEFPVDTIYAQIKRLPPAHTLTWEAGRITIRRYWSLPLDGAIRYRHHRDYIEHFRSVFDRAVRDRLRDDSATAMMSGGMDSTSVAATAQSMLPTPLHAYTTSFAPMFFDDEEEWAARVARKSGMIHHVVRRDRCELFEDESAWRRGEPVDDPLAGVFLDVARDASQHGRIMLAGHGADAVLYTSHGHFRGLLARMRLVAFARDVAGYAWRTHKLPPLNLRVVVKGWFGVEPWRAQFPRWIREEVVTRFDLRARFDATPREELHPLRPEAHRALINPIWTHLFETWDPAETGIPLQVVYPFFDRRVVEFLFALPPMPWFADKFLLREAMYDRLPIETRRRRKTPMRDDPMRIAMNRSIDELGSLLAAAPEVARFVDAGAVIDYLRSDARDGYSDLLAAYPFCLAKWLVERKRLRSGTAASLML